MYAIAYMNVFIWSREMPREMADILRRFMRGDLGALVMTTFYAPFPLFQRGFALCAIWDCDIFYMGQ